VPAEIEIRPAGRDDLPAVTRVTTDAYGVYIERIGKPPAPMLADHAALVAAGEIWVADAGGAVAGVLVVRDEGPALLLESVAVAPDAQGRGIGRALIRWAEQLASDRGLDSVELYTNALMTENLAFYPRLGYESAGRRRGDGYDRVFFRKAVPPAR
jgi:ribosomal protein S18 acetylase RimI-like enzyme